MILRVNVVLRFRNDRIRNRQFERDLFLRRNNCASRTTTKFSFDFSSFLLTPTENQKLFPVNRASSCGVRAVFAATSSREKREKVVSAATSNAHGFSLVRVLHVPTTATALTGAESLPVRVPKSCESCVRVSVYAGKRFGFRETPCSNHARGPEGNAAFV